jgi:methionine-gamma-lyase
MPAIYQTATFRIASFDDGVAMANAVAPPTFYVRYGTPNSRGAEAMLAELEGAEAALVLSSGMAAMSCAVLGQVRAGDHVVGQTTHYTATLSLLTDVLPRYGVGVTQVDQERTGDLVAAIRPGTSLVVIETPTNPTLAVTDIEAVAAAAHEVGALVVCDATLASSYNQPTLEFGCDVVMHSATKYLNGHGDLMSGVLLGRRDLVERLWDFARVTGGLPNAIDAWLLTRGLRTFRMRMPVHNVNADRVARFLEGHPLVKKVYYPGLESHPQHELARKQMPGGFGGLLSFEVAGDPAEAYARARTIVSATRLCAHGASLGSPETLISHPMSLIFSHQAPEEASSGELSAGGVPAGLIRLAVGLEDADDLVADLAAALDAAALETTAGVPA